MYLGDIASSSETNLKYLPHLQQELPLLQRADVARNLKYGYSCEADSYQGDVIRPKKLEIIGAVRIANPKLQNYTTQTEVQSFLGLCNVFRRFVPNFSRLVAPLHKNMAVVLAKIFPRTSSAGETRG